MMIDLTEAEARRVLAELECTEAPECKSIAQKLRQILANFDRPNAVERGLHPSYRDKDA